ncbi:PD40 domain-containing protein, partial [Candidatus Poribacteria bacterium]|nr:PD40 domain-containing protein [Candidatus Poribacteria bacterium]
MKWKYWSIVLLMTVFFTPAVRAVSENASDETQFLTHIRQLTYQGKRAGEGYFSEDGKALIFQSEREPGNPFYQIYTVDLQTGDTHRVSPGVGKTTCAFFRPGTNEVLFASTHLDPEAEAKQKAELEFRASGKERRYSWDYDENMDIFSAARDGSNPSPSLRSGSGQVLRRLTDAVGYDAEGSYSPDGSQIVFCSLRDAYPSEKLSSEDRKRLEVDPAYFGELYLMNADGSDRRRLTHWPGYDGGPFFSPDGERILWRHFDESEMLADIYTMRRDGSDVRRLTHFDSMSWGPYFHPSGEYVIFASNKLGFSNFELYLVDASGAHEPVRVTYTEGFDGLPVFSPDGKRLCWTSNRTRSFSPPAGGEAKRRGGGESQLFQA